MSTAISSLAPQSIWANFEKLNAVPRASKKEEAVIEFIKNFGLDLGLATEVDSIGNVLIRKPATDGMEKRKTVVMQAHLDMVHQKNADVHFDFETQGIDMWVDGDWVRAKGTTLGADNGLGVAAIMGILAATDIAHPQIEALFTIDEETGMTGALKLQPNWLTGDILLNLDTEEDNELGVGCAGGIDVTFKACYTPVSSKPGSAYQISVRGLQGGHSGMDIHKGLGNANKIMNRLLWAVADVVDLSQLNGGSLRNAIPRESFGVVVVAPDQEHIFKETFAKIRQEILAEFAGLEPDLSIEINAIDAPKEIVPKDDFMRLIYGVQATINGVYRMSPDIEGLVEASNNLAKVTVKEGLVQWECLTRSSVESTKWDLVRQLQAVGNLAGTTVEYSGDYPGWAPNMNSPILRVMRDIYRESYGHEPHVAACHAGLECGIIGKHYPELDMISFGPNIRGAHSPDERASISSAQKFWDYLGKTLSQIPER
jgi:dipeptidase D